MSIFSPTAEIYEFTRGTRVYRYTTGDRARTVAGQSYTAHAIRRGRIVQSMEQGKAALELTVPANLPVLELWRPYVRLDRVGIRLSRVRLSDNLVTSSWLGLVSEVDDTGERTSKIKCQSAMAAMEAMGLRRNWQVNCPHVWGSVGEGLCNVPIEDFRVDATLTDVFGLTVESPAFAPYLEGYFDGGFLRWEANGYTETAFILHHDEQQLKLHRPAPLSAGLAIKAYPGCAHTLQVCHDKFGNAVNYGGQHTIPTENPWGTNPVF